MREHLRECGHVANLVPTPDINPIPYIFRLKDGIGEKNQEIEGKVLTLYIRRFSLFTLGFRPNYWAAQDLPRVLNFSLVMRMSNYFSKTLVLRIERPKPNDCYTGVCLRFFDLAVWSLNRNHLSSRTVEEPGDQGVLRCEVLT